GDLTLAVSADPQLRWRGDPLDLTRMLSNLIENALRYGRSPDSDRTELSISAARQAEACELIVSDRGPGVPQAERQRLLRPFSRLDSARSELGGSGLGLAIVARLAQRYGGQCVLEDNPEGSGLRVRIRLPDAASA
ncbi:MAG: ATP-binding protein, partial [Burkholderiaceae bacterium]|nr:ATP-binding protein [Burkholderiaceae bacterium]